MDSPTKTRIVGVPAKTLSTQGYAVCFFPEQPARKTIEEREEVFQKAEVQKVEAHIVSGETYIRLHWRNRLIYIIALISFTLSLNNVYHFPMNIYRFGGNFFIVYIVVTILVGYPLHILETSLGQYSQRGVIWIWECAPLLCGVGFAMVLACILIALSQNIFAAYSLVYLANCFRPVLPWTYCSKPKTNHSDACAPPSWLISRKFELSSEIYFYDVVVDTNHEKRDLWTMHSLKWWLVICLFFSWFVTYVATLRSARSIGKVCVFIVIVTYFTLLMLLIVAFQLKEFGRFTDIIEGVKEGATLFNFEMWCVATMQVIVELGLCYGIPITYGSYCHFRNLFYIDSLVICTLNFLHSLIFFFLFFSFMVRYSCNSDDIFWRLPENTIEIVYIMYSEAFANLSGGNLWCVTFFLMLFCIIIGTQIAVIETILSAIYDNFVYLSNSRHLINLVVCGMFAVLGICFCFSNGLHIAVFLHSFPIWATVIPLSLLFVVGVIFVFGLKYYFEQMSLIREITETFKYRILYFALLIILILVLLVVIIARPPNTLTGDANYEYTQEIIVGLILAIIVAPVVVLALLWTIHCLFENKRIFRCSNTWMAFYEERLEATGQFSKDYEPSYTWDWNRKE